MKSAPTHRLATIVAATLTAAGLASGAAGAAGADTITLEPATPTVDTAADAIAGTCDTGSSAPLAALQNGSGGNLAAFLWPLQNGLNCLTGSGGTPVAALIDLSASNGSVMPVAATTGSDSSGSSALGLKSLMCQLTGQGRYWRTDLGCTDIPPFVS
ncbi:hypothetical protein ACWELJ_23155 [Nocardia sp. NPDC004582]